MANITSNSHQAEGDTIWTPPQYVFTPTPIAETIIDNQYPSSVFARQAKWCADGSCFLTNSEDNRFQMFTMPMRSMGEENLNSSVKVHEIPQPSPIVEFAWFPSASVMDPATFCFAASVRECPVKLLHGSDGRLRASYPIVDHRERYIAPHSLAFTPAMDRLYCGFEDAIEMFDLSAPGHPGTRLHTSPSKKSKDGMKDNIPFTIGIVSALAFTPYSTQGGYFAAGSLSPSLYNISLYDQSQDAPLMYLGAGSSAVRAGVTQLAFNSAKPHLLYASFRRHPSIYVWDLRGPTDEPIQSYQPPQTDSIRTNQKLKFDIDTSGKWLAMGGPAGKVSVWDLDAVPPETDSSVQEPACTIDAHKVGSVSFHPLEPLLLTASGSRHFDSQTDSESESDSDPDFASEEESSGPAIVKRGRTRPFSADNSIKIWRCHSGS